MCMGREETPRTGGGHPLKAQAGDFMERKRFHFDNVYIDNPILYDSIILYQVGDLSCEAGYTIGEHKQFCYEITYIASGFGFHYINGKEYPVKEGDIFLNVPGEFHDGMASNADPFRYFYIGFDFEYAQGANAFDHIKKMFDQVRSPVIQDELGIKAPFLGIFNELINLKEYSDVMIKMHLHQVIIMAYRNYFANWDKRYYLQNQTDTANQIVYEIIHYIDVNLLQIVELSELENQLGYTYSHLSHIFSKKTGLTIKQYYNRKRFEKAIDWMKESDMTLSQVAEKLGYQSLNAFSKAFRKQYGISPTEYQTLHIHRRETDEG